MHSLPDVDILEDCHSNNEPENMLERIRMLMDISLKKPQAASAAKKRKANGKEIRISGHVGTRTEHFLAYVSNVIDALDAKSMKGQYLVMYNAPIHTLLAIRDLIENRGYKRLYLPPYSLFLNPIEELGFKVESGVHRTALPADYRLSDRICEAVNKVIASACQGYIKNSMVFFSRCKDGETDL